MSVITWSRGEKLALLSAQRTLGSVIEHAMRERPDWVVLMRTDVDALHPFMYAFKPRELMSVERSKRGLAAREALDLHETDESPAVRPGEEWTPPRREGVKPCAKRAVLLDAEGELTAVGEEADPEESREARTKDVWRSVRTDPGDELGLGTVRGGHDEASPPPPATIPTESESVEAMLTAEAPSEMASGEEAPVTVLVGLASDTLPFAGGSLTTAVSAREQITAIITTYGAALEALSPRVLKLDPPRENEPSQSAFTVRGRSQGRARIGIIFRQGGTELGTLTLAVTVTDGRRTSGETDTVRAETAAAPRDEGEDGGLLLLIDEDAQGPVVRYRYRVVSSALGLDYAEFSSAPLKAVGGGNASTARAYVESVYKQITERVLRNSDDLKNFARELRNIGSELCREIIPDDLARQLWAKRTDIGGILVRSWEPYIPWELLRLRNPDSQSNETDERFWAEYRLVRSLNGTTRPGRLPLRDWSYVEAKYDFGYAKQVGAEVEYLKKDLPRRHGIQPTVVEPTIDKVLDALNSPGFDVLHIACHGEASHDDIARSTLIIGDRPGGAGQADPVTIDSRTVSAEANLRGRQPLVFLNACESGRLGASLTEWGGWPRTFWERGAGAFVGTSWPVREKPARLFAEAFYEALLGGQTLGEAAGAAREAAKPLGDASWLAYKVYGQPHARRS